MPSVRCDIVAGVAVSLISASALVYATWPVFPAVLAAAILHAAASCVLGPAIAAISLGLVGYAAIGERFGRNARFASIGAGLSAAVMGACGYFFSAQAVFFVTAALLIPALLVLHGIPSAEIDPARAHGNMSERQVDTQPEDLRSLLGKRPLQVFGGCILLFHLANAAMLPLMASVLTMRLGKWATVLIAACMVGPQLIVALFSPWVGRQAERWGRRPLLLAGFAALPVRGLPPCRGDGPLPAGRRPASRRADGRRVQRDGAPDSRRSHARHRAFQSDPGHRRHRDGHRRLAQPDARRLHERRFRQQGRLSRTGEHRRARPRDGLAADAGNPACARSPSRWIGRRSWGPCREFRPGTPA